MFCKLCVLISCLNSSDFFFCGNIDGICSAHCIQQIQQGAIDAEEEEEADSV
jgi:hypothetical protein